MSPVTSPLRPRLPALALPAAGLLLLASAASGGEDRGLFAGSPAGAGAGGPAAAENSALPELPAAPAAGGRRRLWLSLDFDLRRRKLRPTEVRDRFEDNVGGSSFDENLDMDEYSSKDDLRVGTLGLTLHWLPRARLELYAGLRRPLYGKAQHRDIEYDGAPIASPDMEFAHGAALELAAGAGWEALFREQGPARNFGLWVGTEFRAGWGDDLRSPDDDEEFGLDGNDEVEYDADWQALDLELRVFRRFEYTTEGTFTVYAGGGAAWLFYHEKWDGRFELGDEEELMEFDYREKNLFFGSAGLRAERGPLLVEVGGRYGGEYALQVKLGWKF
jgi:hypothetical protein